MISLPTINKGLTALTLLLLALPLCLFAQKKKKIEIINSDVLKFEEQEGEKLRKLIGNVQLKQNEVLLFCDSALFYTKDNMVDAFGNVKVKEGDSLTITCDHLKYLGDQKMAFAYDNVVMNHARMDLKTDILEYDMENKQATYRSGGIVNTKDIELTSETGYYFSESKIAYFKGDVFLDDPEYDLYADTLKYNVNTDVAYFFGPTDIIQQETKIYCETGWYDTKADIGSFGKNTKLFDPPQTLYTDTLYYESALGYGRALKWFEWIDTSNNTILSGKKADYYADAQSLVATDSILLTAILDNDSLFMTSDTFHTFIDTTSIVANGDTTATDSTTQEKGARLFYAYNNVRIYKSDLQGVCDSLLFSYRDSIFYMYKDPLLWNGDNQLKGDTITIMLKNGKIDRINMYQNAFVTNEVGKEIFNQVKGNNIYGYFVNDQLDRMVAEGNCESVYFAQDDDEAYLGVNEAQSARMIMLFEDKKIQTIKFMQQPKALFTPMQQTNPAAHRLPDFAWHIHRKPISKEDLFSPKEDIREESGKSTYRSPDEPSSD